MAAFAFAFAVALVGAGAAGVVAQQIVTPATASRDAVRATKDGLTLPAGEFEVVDLVHAVARFLCRNYLFDDADLDKVPGFTLQRSIALDALGSEEMLYALLAARGLAALPVDELRGVFQIIPLASDRRTLPVTNVPWRTPDEILRRPRLRELVMTAVALRHADAHELANALRAQFSLQGTWQPGVPTAAPLDDDHLLLHGYRDQIAPLLLILHRIDLASEPLPAPVPRAPTATAVPAPDVAAMLRRLTALEQEVALLRRAVRAADAAPTATTPGEAR